MPFHIRGKCTPEELVVRNGVDGDGSSRVNDDNVLLVRNFISGEGSHESINADFVRSFQVDFQRNILVAQQVLNVCGAVCRDPVLQLGGLRGGDRANEPIELRFRKLKIDGCFFGDRIQRDEVTEVVTQASQFDAAVSDVCHDCRDFGLQAHKLTFAR